MDFITQLLSHFAMLTISSILSITFVTAILLPNIVKQFNQSNIIDEENEEIPLVISICNRGMTEEEEESPAMMTSEINKTFNNFLNGKPILVGYKEYDTHREIDVGPPVQCGLD